MNELLKRWIGGTAAMVVICICAVGVSAGLSHGQSRIPLKKAVEEFNRKSQDNPVGKSQTPLTVDEVVAAIRLFRGDLARRKLTDEAKKEYLVIENELSIAETDKISFIDGWGTHEIDGEMYRFKVWWIDLRIEREAIKDRFGRTPARFNLRIRESTISSIKLTKEEAEKHRKKIEENQRYLERQRFEWEQRRMERKKDKDKK